MSETLTELHTRVVTARRAEDIFEIDTEPVKQQQLDDLQKIYESLLRVCDMPEPEHGEEPTTEQKMAHRTIGRLTVLYQEGREKIRLGRFGRAYDFVIPDEKPVSTVHIGSNDYAVYGPPLEESAHWKIYMAARRDAAGVIIPVCFKVARTTDDNRFLENETAVISTMEHVSVPMMHETFSLSDGRVVNSLFFMEYTLSAKELRQIHFPDGLDQRHMVWILERLLNAIGFMNQKRIIHGAIRPKSILVVPYNHNALPGDFTFSIYEAYRAGRRYPAVNKYSPPEMIHPRHSDQPRLACVPHPRTDIYSMGLSMLWLVGGHIRTRTAPDHLEPELKEFLAKMHDPDPRTRARDPYVLFHELRALRLKLFGAEHEFLPLEINWK